jgi:hypothetical protein
VGPRDGLDAVAKRKIPSPCRESNSDRPAFSLVTILTELFRLLQNRVLRRGRKLWETGEDCIIEERRDLEGTRM